MQDLKDKDSVHCPHSARMQRLGKEISVLSRKPKNIQTHKETYVG